MSKHKPRYHGHRFAPQTISYSVWLYLRFSLSFRDFEDLLAERRIKVSYDTIRHWCLKFGPSYRRALKRREGRLGDAWYLDEVFIKIGWQLHYLWRAADQDGDVLDILVQKRRNAATAERFFRKALKGQGEEPRRLTTDKLRSYGPAARCALPTAVHETERYANNRAGNSIQPTRQRERQMRRFQSRHHAQRFLAVHARVQNLFRHGRHQIRAAHHRLFRARAFAVWSQVTCA